MEINGINLSSGPPQSVEPNQYAMQYAIQNGISLEEAKQQLHAKFGNPQNKQFFSFQEMLFPKDIMENMNKQNLISPETIQLQILGIPINVIVQGDNAIKQYADENNIKLPKKKQ